MPLFGGDPVAGPLEVLDLYSFQEPQELKARWRGWLGHDSAPVPRLPRGLARRAQGRGADSIAAGRAWYFEQGPVWLGAQVTGWALAGVSGVVIGGSWAVRRGSLSLDRMFGFVCESAQVIGCRSAVASTFGQPHPGRRRLSFDENGYLP